MKKLDYYVLDVFTDQRFKGNPLSVVWCEEALELKEYYNIAREFGYSETSFVYYSRAEKAFKVRSFTPGNYEVAGAGHNLLGAVCLALIKNLDIFAEQQGEQLVVIKDIKINVVIERRNDVVFVGMKQQTAELLKVVPAAEVAALLGLETEALNLNGWESIVVKTEVAHLMIPVKNSNFLKAAVVNKPLLKVASEKYGFEGCYLFTTDHDEQDYVAVSRFFNPGIGIDEDAATGTAAGPLAGFLSKLAFIEKNKDYQILQGAELNQPSSIHLKVTDEGVWISGSAVITMEGTLYL
jgi:trans-2,3-dihydro-3-hydroxyanthranilate isomerase